MDQTSRPLSEREIRDAVMSRLLGCQGQVLLIEELGVGSARVDLALATDRLLGYEIKSDFDTLDRLARQMHAYHSVFDALTIVTTTAFASQVEALLPTWWGIWVAEPSLEGAVHVHERRSAAFHGRQDAGSLAAMLWRDEAYAFVMDILGPVVRARATRGDLQEVIAGHIPLEQIRARVLGSLRNREDLKARSYVSRDQLTYCEDDMVACCVATPCG